MADDEAAAAAPPPSRKKSKRASLAELPIAKLLARMRYLNLLNGVLIVVVGIVTLAVPSTDGNVFSRYVVAIYLSVFGCTLMCAEAHLRNVEAYLRTWCGMLFSFRGRTGFLIFNATLCGAINTVLGWIGFALTTLNALWAFYAMFAHPAFNGGRLSMRSDPSAAASDANVYIGAPEAMELYLKNNPDVARKAADRAMAAAIANPGAVAAVGGAVVTRNPFDAAQHQGLDAR